MSRKRKSPAITDVSVEAATETVTLRLVMNAFVRGDFAPEGTLFTFSKVEADKRLKNTCYWSQV